MLTRKFGLSMLEALASSITVTISVDTLSVEESASYLEQRLRACGAAGPVFTKNALTLIHQAAGGTLRTLGTIANAALLKAFTAARPSGGGRARAAGHPTVSGLPTVPVHRICRPGPIPPAIWRTAATGACCSPSSIAAPPRQTRPAAPA